MSRPDWISWKHLKVVIKNEKCLNNIINIANTCINLNHWPSHFKMLTSIIIPKPNKVLYDFPKMFWPIILLNTLEKLIKKSEHLQFYMISNNFVYLNQLEDSNNALLQMLVFSLPILFVQNGLRIFKWVCWYSTLLNLFLLLITSFYWLFWIK